MRKELSSFYGREVDTAGDGLLANFRWTCARDSMCLFDTRPRPWLETSVRTGLNTGECELAGDKVIGIACISVRALLPSPSQTTFWFPAPSRIWSPERDSGSPIACRTPSRAFQTNGACLRFKSRPAAAELEFHL